MGGWLLWPSFLDVIGPEKLKEVRNRVAREIGTTFKTNYTAEISLEEALDVNILKQYVTVGTSGKYLIKPNNETSAKL